MQFSIVVAHCSSNGIGIANTLPWHLPSDLKYFKTLTTTSLPGKKNVVIMGRKTYER
jgi:dihydrofolate reductase